MARKRRTNEEAPGWVWMSFGLTIGLIVAFGVYLNGRPVAESSTPPVQDEVPSPASVTAPNRSQETSDEPQTTTSPDPAVAESEADLEDPNRFSFYDELPQFEVIIPEVETAQPRTIRTTAIADPGTYVLQAGSFRTNADAESQRARLALLGIESRIQRVTIDTATFHRVRIGPIEDLDTLNDIRSRLVNASVESLVMRMTE